jgi:hypothetical protein
VGGKEEDGRKEGMEGKGKGIEGGKKEVFLFLSQLESATISTIT